MTDTIPLGTPTDTRFLIIGAGISGILMGIKLKERGYHDFVILEKAQTLGGTWRDNRYPGVACDVAAHLYTYSFAPNPWWKNRYAKGRDILRYYTRVAEKAGILPHIHYGQAVETCHFDDGVWTVVTQAGHSYAADIVISANGRLHHPKLPDIPGMDSFAGQMFHTARWDDSLDVTGKRVGVIGTGSTATQITITLADKVQQLHLFQRTAQWVFPVKNTPNPWWRKLVFALSAKRWQRYHHQLESETEARGKATTGSKEARRVRDQACHDALAAIADPVLRDKLTPNYEVGCKRLVFADGFYDAIQKPSINLVTDKIDRIVPGGLVTQDGTLHTLDVLVYATGFDAHAYLRPMQLTGEGGVTLDQVWADLPLSYQSMTIPHMPNFFMINGPYTSGGSASVVGIVEAQVAYILQLIDHIVTADVTLAPHHQVATQWLDAVREKARNSLWGTGGCDSWYLDKTGTPTLNPSTLSDLKQELAVPILDHYVQTPRRARALGQAA